MAKIEQEIVVRPKLWKTLAPGIGTAIYHKSRRGLVFRVEHSKPEWAGALHKLRTIVHYGHILF
jgi:hypothetical protein